MSRMRGTRTRLPKRLGDGSVDHRADGFIRARLWEESGQVRQRASHGGMGEHLHEDVLTNSLFA